MNNREYGVFPPFERNKLYEITPRIVFRGGRPTDLVKYYGTYVGPYGEYDRDVPLQHVFGLPDMPDWSGEGRLPQDSEPVNAHQVKHFGEYMWTIGPAKKYYAKKAEEIGTMTGTRAQGPATAEGKSARKAPDMVLPRDVTRHIAEFAGQGRRRKTRRTRRS